MQAASECHIYFSFIWPYASGNCGKEGKKLQKIEYLENQKRFSNEMKSIFHNFGNAFLW